MTATQLQLAGEGLATPEQVVAGAVAPIIDPEFAALISPPTADERRELEANLLADGCRDPLVVWAETGILLDGHNRLDVCQRHGLQYRLHHVTLPDREAACDWIDRNQLGRRNLTPDQFRLLLGRRYNRAKLSPIGFNDRESSGGTFCPRQSHATAAALGREHGVSERTVRNAGEFATIVDEVRQQEPQTVAQGEAVVLKRAKAVRAERRRAAPAQRKPSGAGLATAPAPSEDSWFRFRDLGDEIKAALAEMKSLHVGSEHKHPARSLCQHFADEFTKLAQDVWNR